MRRRNFLQLLGLSPLLWGATVRELLAAPGPTVAVAEGTDHARLVRSTVDLLGGMKRFVKPGQTVVVKPNIGWDRSPDLAANTNPVVVRAVVEECLKAGAKRVKVFDRTCNDERRCYQNSGILPALKGLAGVEVKHLEPERYRTVPLKGKALAEWELYGEAVAADVYINVPVLKHHGLSRLTIGMKNVMGIMGGNRGSLHKHLEVALADVHSVFKTHLTVVDATRVLTAHGPQGGDPADVKTLNTVIAATDIVAADAYATTLMGLRPADIAVTVEAHKRGLGEMRLERMRIVRA
jgi:uncharacterized protein (DUF362 family)